MQNALILEAALEYASHQWHVYPVDSSGKKPQLDLVPNGYTDATTDPNAIRQWFDRPSPPLNIGVRPLLSGFVALDIDQDESKCQFGLDTWQGLTERHGKPPRCTTVMTPSGGRHIHIPVPPGAQLSDQNPFLGWHWVEIAANRITVPPSQCSRGAYIAMPESDVCSPREPDDEFEAWRWLMAVAPNPDHPGAERYMEKWARGRCSELGIALPSRDGSASRGEPIGDADFWLRKFTEEASVGDRHETARRLALQLYADMSAGMIDEATAEATLLSFQEAVDDPLHPFPEEEVMCIWQWFLEEEPDVAPAEFNRSSADADLYPPLDITDEQREVLLFTERTDFGMEKRFVMTAAGRLAHTAATGWMVFDGVKWSEDDHAAAMHSKCLVRTMQMVAREHHGAEESISEGSDGPLASHLRFTRHWATHNKARLLADAARGLMTRSIREFDADDFLFQTQNTTIDLRTGEPRAPSSSDLIMSASHVHHDDGAECPGWLRFLDQVVGDNETIETLQTAVGYTLTGDMSERMMFILVGDGLNGKSTFVNVIAHLMGSYAGAITRDFVIHNPRADDERLNLQLFGRRMVHTAELGDKGKLNENVVKQATGRDIIQGRYLYREPFEFTSKAKIWLSTNFKPSVTGEDQAIWDRMVVIPFEHRIPAGEIDKRLQSRLLSEAPGILNWAIEGCLRWQERGGLVVSPMLVEAKQKYRREEDPVANFVDECCVLGENREGRLRDLYGAFQSWSNDQGSPAMGSKRFSRALEKMRFVKVKDSSIKFVGLQLAPEARGFGTPVGGHGVREAAF